MSSTRERGFKRLSAELLKMRKVAVAYSGGVDSTFLLAAAKKVLGRENVLAVTALSESYPQSERRQAERLAKKLSVKQVFIKTDELNDRNFTRNPVDRCYYCKKALFTRMKKEAKRRGFTFLLDGSTRDDLSDIRYGKIAAREEGIRSPIQDAGLGKDDVRKLSKKMGIKNWDKPSFACLASRFSYNQKITKEKLRAIEEAEDFIKKMGFGQLRVRCHHGTIIRIEVSSDQSQKLLKKRVRERIVAKLKSLGFIYITLDLAGYRSGSMNEEL